MTGERCRRSRPWLSGTAAVAVLLLAAACQPQPTDFLQRTAEDCRGGDTGACELLSDLRPNASSEPKPKQARMPPTPVQRDVDAIIEGMRHAHSTPRPSQPTNLPPDSSQPPP